MNERLEYLIETLSTWAEPAAVELAQLAKEEIRRLNFTIEQLNSVYTFLDIQKSRLANVEQALDVIKAQVKFAEGFIPEAVKKIYIQAWTDNLAARG